MIRGLGLLNRTCFHLNCGSHAPSIRLIVLLHPVIVRSLALPSGLRSVSHKSNISLDCVVLIPRLWANIQCLSDPSLSLFLTHIFTSVRRRPRSWRRYELHGFPVGSQHHVFHRPAQRTTYQARPFLPFLPPTAAAAPFWTATQFPKPDRKSTRLNSSHSGESRMPSSA